MIAHSHVILKAIKKIRKERSWLQTLKINDNISIKDTEVKRTEDVLYLRYFRESH